MRLEGKTIPSKQIVTKIKNPKRILARRQQIINGAIKVFNTKGYYNSTTKEIAQAAGMTEGTLYNYIGSKEDIIYIVYEYITDILRSELEKAISGSKDPKDRLKTALMQILRTIDKHQDIIMFIYKESKSLDRESLHTVLARETEYIEIFQGLLNDYFGEKKIETRKLKLSADLIAFIPVIWTFRRWSLNRRFSSSTKVFEDIIEFILYGIEFARKSSCKR